MEKKELSLDEMEAVTGGFVVNDPVENKFWVIRQNGTVIAPASSQEDAIQFAKAFSTSPTVITKEEYVARYGRELVW